MGVLDFFALRTIRICTCSVGLPEVMLEPLSSIQVSPASRYIQGSAYLKTWVLHKPSQTVEGLAARTCGFGHPSGPDGRAKAGEGLVAEWASLYFYIFFV